MKAAFSLTLLCGSLLLAACGQQEVHLDKTAQKASYALGYHSGVKLHQATPEVDVDAFLAGLRAGNAGKSQLSDEEMTQSLADFRARMIEERRVAREKLAGQALAAAREFLKQNAAKPEVKQLAGGVQYTVEKSGRSNGQSPNLKQAVELVYSGSLLNGKVFDSSASHDKPAIYPLDSLMAGLQIALVKMHPGDKWKLFVPPELGFGDKGAGKLVGPNELLILDVELKRVLPLTQKTASK